MVKNEEAWRRAMPLNQSAPRSFFRRGGIPRVLRCRAIVVLLPVPSSSRTVLSPIFLPCSCKRSTARLTSSSEMPGRPRRRDGDSVICDLHKPAHASRGTCSHMHSFEFRTRNFLLSHYPTANIARELRRRTPSCTPCFSKLRAACGSSMPFRPSTSTSPVPR